MQTPTPAGAKESFGSSLFRTLGSSRISRPVPAGSKDSWKQAKEASSIGNSSWRSARKDLSPLFAACLDRSTPNSDDRKPQKTMSGKSSPESLVPNSSWEPSPFVGTHQKTGMPFGLQQLQMTFFPSQPQLEYRLTELSEESALTTRAQLLWNDFATSSGARLELASREGRGKKPRWMLTLKIPEPSGGADTAVRQMLSSMNFEEVSTLATSSVGSTVIQSWWKSKEDRLFLQPSASGLHQIWIPVAGIRS